MGTGFYRVQLINRDNRQYFKYQIRNKILRKEIIRKDIYELKQAVEECGLLWGIVNLQEAQEHKGRHSLKVLQGKYGLQV